jgi:hypothetical protein
MGKLNMKNPACYIYGKENGCIAGEHFSSDQPNLVWDLASYQSFAFKVPGWPTAANTVTVLSLLAALGVMVLGFLLSIGNGFGILAALRQGSKLQNAKR